MNRWWLDLVPLSRGEWRGTQIVYRRTCVGWDLSSDWTLVLPGTKHAHLIVCLFSPLGNSILFFRGPFGGSLTTPDAGYVQSLMILYSLTGNIRRMDRARDIHGGRSPAIQSPLSLLDLKYARLCPTLMTTLSE